MNRPLATLTVCLALLSVFVSAHLPSAHASSPGKNFDNIVVIAMENQPYSTILGDGTNDANCPLMFLCSMLPYSATILQYNGYGQGIDTGCSADCYFALTTGTTGVSDQWCNSGNCQSVANIAGDLGLTTALYCENACPRQSDHYPFYGYTDTYSQALAGFTCTSCTEPTTSFGQLLNTANSQNPPQFIWFTPTDCHNMHGNDSNCPNDSTDCNTSGCPTAGDNYLKQMLVGSGGTIQSPASGSLLASSLFSSGHRTLLMIWWDECGNSSSGSCDSTNDTPNIFYGPNASVKEGYVCTTTNCNGSDEYNILKMIEDNFGVNCLVNDCNSNDLADLFTGTNTYTLSFQGFDYDGANEETLTLNNQQLIRLPAVDSPQNGGVYVNFTVDMTPLVVTGTNTLVFTHANSDCGVTDTTGNVQITNGAWTIIFSDPTERPLDCTNSITYTFNV